MVAAQRQATQETAGESLKDALAQLDASAQRNSVNDLHAQAWRSPPVGRRVASREG